MYDEKIAREIMGYFREHPYSGDSVEGISRWWLMQQRISESLEVVQQVLEHLNEIGFLYERKTADGHSIYFAANHPDASAPIDVEKNFEGGLLQ
jgi:hypothetical protein